MRLFFALTFSPAARAALRQAQERLRAFAPGARYPGEETLHLTLAFLGEIPEPRAPQLGELLAALPAPPLALRFSQAGPLSPEEGLWALFPEECPALFALQGELAARLEGYEAVGIEVTDAYYKLGGDRVRLALSAHEGKKEEN